MNFLAFAPFVRPHMQCGSIHVGPRRHPRRDGCAATSPSFCPGPAGPAGPPGAERRRHFAVSTCGHRDDGPGAGLAGGPCSARIDPDVTIDRLAFDSLGSGRHRSAVPAP